MTKSDNNILTLNEFYMIYSTVTKFPYMDENRAAFLFTTDYDAQSFVKSHCRLPRLLTQQGLTTIERVDDAG